jgi:DNA-binding transcriptional ArsR family regulator
MSEDRHRRGIPPKAKAMSHRLRTEVLNVLFTRHATAAEIASELEQPVGRVRYQLRVMMEKGLVTPVEERKRRGAVERVYATGDHILDLEEFAGLPVAVKDRINAGVTRLAMSDAIKAQRAGTFNSRDDSAFVRFPLLADERGWSELAEIHQEVCDRVARVRDECRERLEADKTLKAIPAVSINLLFEAPGL